MNLIHGFSTCICHFYRRPQLWSLKVQSVGIFSRGLEKAVLQWLGSSRDFCVCNSYKPTEGPTHSAAESEHLASRQITFVLKETQTMPILIFFLFTLKLPMLLCRLFTDECFVSSTDNVYQDGDLVISAFLPLYTYQTSQHTEGAESIDVSPR